MGTHNRKKHPCIRLVNQKQVPMKKLNGNVHPSHLQLQDINGDGRAGLMAIQEDGSYTIFHGQNTAPSV
ncbi:hypothetical protein [Candidatus Williamhamiltonella defendens]|uniref:hypothetical protein n=1 Tax=Candidatus Williamhamiltonella defendens TaxID=138072 RepID=UPI001C9E09B5|nr:hypothetical protein [Candidatus Hamiltonella defensa]